MTATTKSKNQKVFDVAKPNSVPANPTTKSIIVGHGALMRDPSINQPQVQTEDGEAVVVAPMSGHGMTISPLAHTETAPPEKTPSAPPVADIEPTPIVPVDESPPIKPPVENPVASEVADKPQSEDKTTSDISAAQAKEEQAAQEAADQKIITINALAASGKYFLPINRQEKKRNRQFVFLGLVIVLLLSIAWLDVALDAGLIFNNYHLPHSHFFAAKS